MATTTGIILLNLTMLLLNTAVTTIHTIQITKEMRK
ncbi:hypothetical protein CPT_Mater57 [Bacillus phage Mater]|uniref:Uncharacterized protein n=1 Tax=Bacillus phage Mater TaxID=1540090 RepID=A0A0A0RNJ1_9CAUD|nr:hypothetical protein CPT_Mater57 [Bacillus phage Mater]AIW03214.1 hypothetical protein CPT_Mater57 [Bacillus phage Mater]